MREGAERGLREEREHGRLAPAPLHTARLPPLNPPLDDLTQPWREGSLLFHRFRRESQRNKLLLQRAFRIHFINFLDKSVVGVV